MKNIPNTIYLQVGDEAAEPDDDFTALGDVTWCQDRVFKEDVEYRRVERGERKMEIQYLGKGIWEVTWGNGELHLCREEQLRKCGFADSAIDTSREHPEQVFEI